MINVVQLPPTGMWCLGWIENLFSGPEYSHVSMFERDGNGAVVIIPAEYRKEELAQINGELQMLPWAVVILASDECGLFPVEELELQANQTLWVMTPHFEKHAYPEGTNFIGEYYPPQARQWLQKAPNRAGDLRTWNASFSGQVTHERRTELAEALEGQEDVYLNKTKGFTQGLRPADYYRLLADSQCVPAPSGPCTLDSFRAFEALEAGAVPILDLVCPIEQDGERYWNAILGAQHPLPTIENWHDVMPIVDDINDNWPRSSNLVYSWWQMHKREMKYRILSGIPDKDTEETGCRENLTILMPTSPVPSNPSLDKITQTIESVRFHHPTADILILCDGVRPEQVEREEAYDEFLQHLLWKANFEWTNVYPIVFDQFSHQANMTRAALDYVHTDLILFVEHDIPLVTDMPIDWDGIYTLVRSDQIDVLKFSFEAMGIHPEHEHMALDPEIVHMNGVPIRRTIQWSQRPHVAQTRYYRWMIETYFPPTNRTMIEDRMHSVAQEWPELNVLATYMPEGSKVRCFHIDGRETDVKFDMIYE